MKMVIEFYRVRRADDARAVVGRETVDASDLEHAIEIAQQLRCTLNMPQRPDAVTISDNDGKRLYLHSLGTLEGLDEKPSP